MELEKYIKCKLMFICLNYPSLYCLNCIHNEVVFKKEVNNIRKEHYRGVQSCTKGTCDL